MPPWLLVVALVTLGLVVTLAAFRLTSRRPGHLGLVNGRLAPCPPLPNCVCTEAPDAAHRIDPIAFQGRLEDARYRLLQVLAGMPRARVVRDDGNYLHAEFRSLLFRFVDDVEFLIDDQAKLIHFRSASRAGRYDFGVNRARMEAVRKAFGQAD